MIHSFHKHNHQLVVFINIFAIIVKLASEGRHDNGRVTLKIAALQ